MDPRLLTFAKQMRREPSPAEAKFWHLVRRGNMAGFRFRRQHVIEPYIADFYCPLAKLIVELDGDTHVGQEAADEARTESFETRGYIVLRFWNTQLFDDHESVMETVYRMCVERTRNNEIVEHRLNGLDQIGKKGINPLSPLRPPVATTLSPTGRG